MGQAFVIRQSTYQPAPFVSQIFISQRRSCNLLIYTCIPFGVTWQWRRETRLLKATKQISRASKSALRCSIKQSYNRYILIHWKVLIGEISASFVKLTAMKYAKNTFVLFGINNIDKTCLYTESYICIGYTQANKQYIWVKRRTCCASKRRGPWASCYKTACDTCNG